MLYTRRVRFAIGNACVDGGAEYTNTVRMAKPPSENDLIAIGERITMIREALGMIPADFARLVDLTTQSLSNYETGYRRPNLDQAFKIARKTGATLDYIYFGDESGLPQRIAVKLAEKARRQKIG